MEMISRPLEMTERANREMLRVSEDRLIREGSAYGNRQQRRLAARQERKQRQRDGVEVENENAR